MTLQTIIENACADVVKAAGGNKTLAARLLEINRVTLRKYLLGYEKRLKFNQRKRSRNAGGNDQRDSG